MSTINDRSKESMLLVYASNEGAYQSAQLRSLMSFVLPAFNNGNPGDGFLARVLNNYRITHCILQY